MATENWEMAGEWLNAKTSTGMISHWVMISMIR